MIFVLPYFLRNGTIDVRSKMIPSGVQYGFSTGWNDILQQLNGKRRKSALDFVKPLNPPKEYFHS